MSRNILSLSREVLSLSRVFPWRMAEKAVYLSLCYYACDLAVALALDLAFRVQTNSRETSSRWPPVQ